MGHGWAKPKMACVAARLFPYLQLACGGVERDDAQPVHVEAHDVGLLAAHRL